MFSHTAASWAEAEVILSYFILILQIEFVDTRLQLSKHHIIKLIEVSYLCIMCRKSNGLHESPPTKMSSMGLDRKNMQVKLYTTYMHVHPFTQ